MSKHTPGALRYNAKLSGSENHRGFTVSHETGFKVAEIMPIDPDGIEGGKLARLMCAAPEMLKALKLISGMVEQYQGYIPKEILYLDEAKAAISKAEEEAV